jgi:hypothetical protein
MVLSKEWLGEFGLAAQLLTQKDILKYAPYMLEALRAPLKRTIALITKRMQWLRLKSRQGFGMVVEPRVAILVDDTLEDSTALKKLLELVVEEQLEGKVRIVLVAVGPHGVVGVDDGLRPQAQAFPVAAASQSQPADGSAAAATAVVGQAELDRMYDWIHHIGDKPDHVS